MDPEKLLDMNAIIDPKIIVFTVVDRVVCRMGLFYTIWEALELAATIQDRGLFSCVIVDNFEPLD